MSNALLLNWSNFCVAISRLPSGKQPLSRKQQQEIFGKLTDWYREFTDVPAKQLDEAEKQFNESLKSHRKEGQHVLRGAVLSGIAFLHAYLEAAEMVNMSQFGDDEKRAKALTKMTKKLATFHTSKLDGLGWLIDWLEQVDPLFPANAFNNKLSCCFSNVARKACYDNHKRCAFDSSLSWIRTPSATLSGMAKDDDCCLGTTLSTCSGGTLSCDCVSGNTGCDCKAPNRLCEKNEKSVSVSAAGFGGINCLVLDDAGEKLGGSPSCLALDPAREGGCVLDYVTSPFAGSLCQLLDPQAGRFVTARSGGLNLGRLMMTNKDCVQTGFCPPKGGGCDTLC